MVHCILMAALLHEAETSLTQAGSSSNSVNTAQFSSRPVSSPWNIIINIFIIIIIFFIDKYLPPERGQVDLAGAEVVDKLGEVLQDLVLDERGHVAVTLVLLTASTQS